MKKTHRGYILITGLFLLGRPVSGQTGGDIQIIKSNAQGCVFTWKLSSADYEIAQVSANGKEYMSVQMHKAFPYATPGSPAILFRTVRIVLPPGASVSGSIQYGSYQAYHNVTLIPEPHIDKSDRLGVDQYILREGNDYMVMDHLPRESLVLSQPTYLRDWSVVTVRFSPMRYHPRTKSLRLYKQLTVVLNYRGGRVAAGYRQPTENAEALFLNAEQAANWKVKRVRTMDPGSNPFQDGLWYKIQIVDEGIYRLDRKFFENLGIKPSTIDPRSIRLFNNGGSMLPILPAGLDFSDPATPTGVTPLALVENAIHVGGEADGKFDGSDFVQFYGRGTDHWTFDAAQNQFTYQKNFYTETNEYWLNINSSENGKRIVSTEDIAPAGTQITSFVDHYHYEKDEENYQQSGLVWLARALTAGQSRTYPEPGDISSSSIFTDLDIAMPVSYTIKFKGVLALSSVPEDHRFSVSVDGNPLGETPLFQAYTSAVLETNLDASQVSAGKITATYSPGNSNSQAALDWFEARYGRQLKFEDGWLRVFSPIQSGTYTYRVETDQPAELVQIWDVTDAGRIESVPFTAGPDGTLEFTVAAAEPRIYVIFSEENSEILMADAAISKNFSDLQNTANSADHLIITHKDFMSAAELLAEHRATHSDMKSVIVDIDDVFDEFSAGMPDPTAIRDFLRYAYYHWQPTNLNEHVRYVLLLGDGDYDYRDIKATEMHNWIPTYQIQSDAVFDRTPINTREVDDAFVTINDTQVALDNTDGNVSYPYLVNALPDLAIGRIPCRTVEEAQAVIDKIIMTESAPEPESWKHTVTLIADDELVPSNCNELVFHLKPVEFMARDESKIPAYWIQRKIYLTDFPAEQVGTRIQKRTSSQAIIEQMNSGSMIVSYTGHGNPFAWAHEGAYIHREDFSKIQNFDRYFFLSIYSCNFGRFDLVENQGGGEEVLLAADRGAFALLSATREVFAGANTALMNRIFEMIHQTPTLGDAVSLSKSGSINDEKYHLLGDPASHLPAYEQRVEYTSGPPVRLTALEKATITGRVLSESGNPDLSYNGPILMSVYDRAPVKFYEQQCASFDTINYELPARLLYRGFTRVESGSFMINLITPKDLSYSNARGSVIGISADGKAFLSGFSDNIIIDSSTALIIDTTGPEISIAIDDQNFSSGDLVPQDALIDIMLSDASGINITNTLGHKFQLVIDKQFSYNLAEYFLYDQDSYTTGSAGVYLSGLVPGRHEAEIVAFDNANNVAKKPFSFELSERSVLSEATDNIQLSEVLNYPNPLRNRTHFTFSINHTTADVRIRVYTVAGRLIKKLESNATFGYNSILWDVRDEDGDSLSNGVYLYKVTVISKENDTRDSSIGKLVVAK